jgi:hypothetical protein
MITRETLQAAKAKFAMHIKLAKGGYIYVYNCPDLPRLEKQIRKEHAHAQEERLYYVDGWECRSTDEILRRLNAPEEKPPLQLGPERTAAWLEERIQAFLKDPQLMEPTAVVKEFEREIKERRRVYLSQIIKANMDVDKAAVRIAMFTKLKESWQAEAQKGDLFGERDNADLQATHRRP